MSFFAQNTDRKQRVLQNLRDAIAGIEEGRVEILEEIMLNSKSDGMGYTKHGNRCDSMFFGFEYILKGSKPAVTVDESYKSTPIYKAMNPPPSITPEPIVTCAGFPPTGESIYIKPEYDAKLSNVQLERMKSNGVYTCTKCKKFTTDSGMGMKKHYNRCGV